MKVAAITVLAFIWSGAVLRAQVTDSAATLKQAQQMIESGDLQRASDLLSDVVAHDPQNDEALIALGEVQLREALHEDAMKSFESALARKPDLQKARDGEVEAAEAAALADRKVGIDGSALLCLVRARKFVPDSPRLLFDFGMQADSMRIFGDADTALTRARELAPNDAKILYALAHVQLDEQKMPQAEANLRAYLKLQPRDATAHYGLGHLLHMLARNDEAEAELRESLRLQPQQTSSYYELGEVALEMNRFEDAKKDYGKVLDLAPHHGGALTGMGIVAYRAKDYAQAEKYLKDATEYAPDYATAHHYYALVLARLGRAEESKREAELATQLNVQEVKLRRGNTLTIVQ